MLRSLTSLLFLIVLAGCFSTSPPPEVLAQDHSATDTESEWSSVRASNDAAALEVWAAANPGAPERFEALVRAARLDFLGGPVPGRPESGDPRAWLGKYALGATMPQPSTGADVRLRNRALDPLVERALGQAGDPALVEQFLAQRPDSPVAGRLRALHVALLAASNGRASTLSLGDGDLMASPDPSPASTAPAPYRPPTVPSASSDDQPNYIVSPGVLEVRITRQAQDNGWTRVDYEVTNKSRHHVRNWGVVLEIEALGTDFPPQSISGYDLAPRQSKVDLFHVRNERRILNLDFDGEISSIVLETEDASLQAKDQFDLQVR